MTTLQQYAQHFGITEGRSKQGKPVWTIDIAVDGAGTRPRSAYWDAKSKVWRLDTQQDVAPYPPGAHVLTHESRPNKVHPREPNWIDALPPTDHKTFFSQMNWKNTPLGPCENWPHALRLYTHVLFSDKRAAAIYWGPKRVAIYNEHLTPLIGNLHPSLMGNAFEAVMPEIWGFFEPLFQSIEKDQKGFEKNGLELPSERNGFLEETWWDGGSVSLRDDHGYHAGVYFSWTEVTRTVLQDRRTSLRNKLGLSLSTSVSSTWKHIHDVLAQFPRDIPMAILYSTDERGELVLQHTLGVDHNYKAVPNELDFVARDRKAPLASLFRRALDDPTEFIVIDQSKEALDPAILEHATWLGFGEPSRYLAVIPIRASSFVRGFVILGLNPRLEFDVAHEQFVVAVARQLRDLMTKVTTREDTQKREEYLKKELNETERRISRLAEVVPVGIYELAADGMLLWANSQFWEIMEVPQGYRNPATFDWTDYIHPEDQARATAEMTKSLMEAVDISDALRLKRTYRPPQIGQALDTTEEPFWIMYSASPYLRPDGTVHSLMGSLTDISHLKWAEQLSFRNAESARKERKRQEEFIDITSHEMRNPLSAITQCADSVILSLQEAKENNDTKALFEIIRLNAESAESILFCAAHQRRIIDDVLTLGKLDSKLLTVSPKAFQPKDLVEQALQMFGTECEVHEIDLQTTVGLTSTLDRSSTVYGDPSRLMQIMVNLLSNAIKFTRSRLTRNITIRFGFSSTPPTTELFGHGFKWYSTGTVRPDLTNESEYGCGEVVYIYYAIIDSGKGIAPEFVDNVFTKFNQAERRTHTEYGGSGLGLYISQELTEMQGGLIGIESQAGVGSTFAFYTKARLSQFEPPESIDSTGHVYAAAKESHGLGSLDVENKLVPVALPTSAEYKILLVEDNVLNQKILAKQLRKAGCTVRVSNNGGEAVDSVLQMCSLPCEYATPLPDDDIAHFDCILMDWEMPVCDGIKASKKIREIETRVKGKKNIIIGVTANARAEQISMAKEAGMDAVMPKPFRVSELLAKIAECVGKAGDVNGEVR